MGFSGGSGFGGGGGGSSITVPNGIAKGNGTVFSAATPGTDYLAPVGLTKFDINKQPSSPASQNDEFNGSSLGGIWTGVNVGSRITQDFTTKPGWFCITHVTGDSGGDTCRAFLQALPAGDFTIAARLRVRATAGDNFNFAGLCLTDGVTVGAGGQLIIGNAYNSGWKYGVQRETNFSTYASSPIANAAVTVFGVQGPGFGTGAYIDFLVRLRRSGSTYYAAWNYDQLGGFDPNAWTESTYTPVITPAYMGLMTQNSGTGTLTLMCDWFRYFPSATATIGGLVTQ